MAVEQDSRSNSSEGPTSAAINEKSATTAPTKAESETGPTTPSNPKAKKHGLFSKKRKDEHNSDAASTSSSNDSSSSSSSHKKAAPGPTPVPFSQLFRYSTKFELFLDFIGLICAVAAGAAQPLLSLLFGNLTTGFVDFAKAIIGTQSGTPESQKAFLDARNHFRDLAAKNSLWLVVIGIGMFIATYVYMLTWTYTGEVNSKRIRERYLSAVLRQEIAYFDNLGAGEVATRIQTDTHLIQQGISEKVALIASYLGAFFTGFILAYARSWKLSLAISSILPCIAITGAVMQIFISKYMQLSLKHVAEAGSLAEEVISTVRTAQAFGTQAKLSKIYDNNITQARGADLKAAVVNGIGLGIFFFVIYASYALAFHFGTTLILKGQADAGMVVNVFISILIGAFSLALLAPEAQAVSHARAAAAKLFATIDRVPEIDSYSEEGLRPDSVVGAITLEDVDFHYPSRPDVPILKKLSIEFEAGKTAALVGASGSGKSTIVSLVERFYDPIDGKVRLDGVDLKDLNVRWLRSQIGLVSQEPSLFATTIKGNVAHGLVGTQWENVSDEEKFKLVTEACVKANADSFIQKLPNGYETLVGERGFLLSGGQKQRIAIARAIVSDPRILLLDEATSALDTQSEGIVQDALDKAAAGRTTITIAHRLSTIKDADQIYVMGSGMVLEHGTHNELLANEDGPYARLVNAQKLREARPIEEDDLSSSDEKTAGGVTPAGTTEADMFSKEAVQEAMKDEVPLGRTTTGSGRSLASEVISQKRAAGEGRYGKFGDKEYHMPYLFKRMGKINRVDLNLYIWGTIFAIMGGMVYPAFGIVFGKAIESFSLPDPKQLRFEGDRNALWLFIIAILATVAIGFQNYYFSTAAASLTSKLRSLSFKAILRQDIGWFDEEKNSTGGLVSILSNNPTKISGLAGVTLGAIVQSIATVIGGAVIGLAFGPKLAAVGIACTPLVISAGYIRLRVVVLKDQTNKAAHEVSAQLACEAAGSIRTVQSLTRERECTREYSESLEESLRMSNRTSVLSTFLFAISQAMSFFVIALVFWYGSRLVSDLVYDTFQFFVCLMSVVFGSIQAGNVFSFVPDISSAKGAASDIINLLDNVPEVDSESPDGVVLDKSKVKGQIRFEDVHFRYPTRPGVRVLRNLNFIVEPGTYVAIVGQSGSGKSTTIQLIERFYDPLAGRIMLDGVDISSLNVQDYRRNISLVSQEPTLYAGTIRFNILLGAIKPAEEVTQEEIEKACRDANILEFIEELPQGFDTEVGGKGSQLSGGQKQRIAIARALLRDPKVLLLDEATSALDSQSEKVVQAALDNAARGRTTIAIAHRLSTIQNADKIFYIKDGKVSEVGTHDELLKLRGGYYELVQLQALSRTNDH